MYVYKSSPPQGTPPHSNSTSLPSPPPLTQRTKKFTDIIQTLKMQAEVKKKKKEKKALKVICQALVGLTQQLPI